MLPAEALQPAGVILGQEVRAHPLVAFGEHPGDVLGLDPLLLEAGQEQLEGGVLVLEAVGKRNLDEALALVQDPAFLGRHAPGQLGAHGAAVEGVVKRDEVLLVLAVPFQSVGPGQLDGVLDGLAARGQQEHLVVLRVRREGLQGPGQLRPALMDEDVSGQQGLAQHLLQGPADLPAAVSGVGNEDPARPVDPAVAPAIPDLESFGPVPDDGRLPHHGLGLRIPQGLEDRQGLRHRQAGADAAVPGPDRRHLHRGQVVTSHGSLLCCPPNRRERRIRAARIASRPREAEPRGDPRSGSPRAARRPESTASPPRPRAR